MRLRTTLSIPLAAALLLAGATLPRPALASAPATGSGTVSFTSERLTSMRFAGGNVIVTVALTGFLTGTLSGPFTESLVSVQHPDGTETFQATSPCACRIAGQAGSVTLRIVGAGITGGSNTGHLTLLGGTGGLANLRGQGTFSGSEAGESYTLSYHFDP
jgi:hypothetical protein